MKAKQITEDLYHVFDENLIGTVHRSDESPHPWVFHNGKEVLGSNVYRYDLFEEQGIEVVYSSDYWIKLFA